MFTPNGSNPPNVFYVHNDHIQTPRVVTNPSGVLRWTWMAEPFGTTAANTNPAGQGAFTFNLRHPGQYADSESGLFYNYFRDYDATVGRYAQSDPIGLEGGINTYAYVGGNPLSFVDPRGEQYYMCAAAGLDAWCSKQPPAPPQPLSCMEKCLIYGGALGGVKTAAAEGIAQGVASRGYVGAAYGWAWFNYWVPYFIPASAFGIYLTCKRECDPYCPGDGHGSSDFGAP